MSLLDLTQDQNMALGLLGLGMLQQRGGAGFGAGAANAMQFLAGAKDRERQAKKDEMEMGLLGARMKEYESKIAQENAERERQANIQRGLPSLLRPPGMAGGEPVPQSFAGTDIPMFSQPMGAAPMRQTPGGFDMQRALTELRMTPAEAKAYAEALTFGKPKVARTVEVMRNGKPTLIQLDESGQEIGQGYDQWKAPIMQDFGGNVGAIDPVTRAVLSQFPKTMSPEGRDASARGWASNAIQRERLNLEQGNAVADAGGPSQVGLVKQFGKPPKDYRWKPDGTTEPIPGGPADIKAGELGEKTRQRQQGAIAQADSVLKEIRDAKALVGWDTAGVGGVTKVLPATPARNLAAKLETIKANLGFDRLQQMREQSPTGGALGQVAVQELTALQSTVASFDQLQGADQLGAALDKAEQHYTNWRNIVNQARNPQGGASGSWEPAKEQRYQEWKRGQKQ